MSLALRGIGRRHGSGARAVDALRDVTLDVGDGELFCLLGPSGCGKTTLLELCAGLQRPTSGTIRIDGRVVADAERGVCVPPRRRDVAMVFQSYALYPHMSVFDNVAFPLRVARRPPGEIERAVGETAAMLGISPLLERRPAALSGGQRQRVAIARAVVRRPALFLLDEPLSNLDARLRAGTRAELKALQRRLGVTTLHVTHDQAEAMTLGDRIALLGDGELVQVGTPRELYERPATAFVAGFLGSPPMNLVPVRIELAAGGALARLGELTVPLPSTERVRVTGEGPALLGIRPERLRIEAGRGPAGEPGFVGRVRATEDLGRETLCHVAPRAAPEQTFLVPTTARGVREGSEVRVGFAADDVHVFPVPQRASRP